MYQIVTGFRCDLPYHVLVEEKTDFLSVNPQSNGQELVNDLGEAFNYDHYMNQLKNGAMSMTSQISVGWYLEFFRSYAEEQISVLYVAFPSGLNGSYSSALQAAELLKEECEDPEICIFNTKAASIGKGPLVLEAARLKKEGKNIEEILEWLGKSYLRIHSWVTIDDLKYLERGDRISKASATLGSPLSVKPITTADKEGRLMDADRVRGRNKSVQTIVNETVKIIAAPPDQIIYVAYAGDPGNAEKARRLLEEQIKTKGVKLYPLGLAIASYIGYGCIVIFSMGISR